MNLKDYFIRQESLEKYFQSSRQKFGKKIEYIFIDHFKVQDRSLGK